MKEDHHTSPIVLNDMETTKEMGDLPFMGFIFLKALYVSLFRSNTITKSTIVGKNRIVLKNYHPDKNQISAYKKVCAFSENKPDTIPTAYLQTLFIGLLGEFITSPLFPISPLGLIHIFQSFDLKRPVNIDETLDLTCTLTDMRKTEKGIETEFTQDVMSGNTLVWQGVSTFLTKNRKRGPAKKTPSNMIEDAYLEQKTTLPVPAGTGRQYAKVSGDYNPHHLHTMLAKLFGFKKAIAHGMWSLASVVACLEQEFDVGYSSRVEAFFKLPIFMPATTAIGYEHRVDQGRDRVIVNFELRDQKNGRPHLKGNLLYPNSGS